ncbi:MAG: GntP family permease [Ruoffia tabacinasalis]|uniref:GntP family permease n=1 Tax=unclassified Ruoffia TaxID=2862149 RepID=UPI000EC93205|nr:GntP family permease [Aerococcaceae bacterium]
METLGILGIVVAIIAIIVMAVRGLHIVIAAPLATLIVILTNRMDIFASLIGPEQSYMAGLAGFLINNFAIFLLGAILAQYMEKSNATISIANFILSKVGLKNKYAVMVALSLIAAILTYGGISLYVVMFALVPLARPIFKRMDINWELFPIPLFFGMATFTMSMLPGAPSVQNAVPTTALGTTLTSAPLLSIVATIVMILFGLGYMKFELNKSIRKNETFYSYLGDSKQADLPEEAEVNEGNLPSVMLSLTPIISLIAIILIFSKVPHIILIALTVAIILSAVLYNKYIESQNTVLSNGAAGSVMPAFSTSSSVAFGSVLTSASGFAIIQDMIMAIPGNPIIGLAVASSLLAGITGSSSGALGIVMESFAPNYLEMGISPELIHRVAVIASATLTAVPQSGVTITFNNLTGLSIRRGFKHQFIIINGGHLLALIAVLIVSALLY